MIYSSVDSHRELPAFAEDDTPPLLPNSEIYLPTPAKATGFFGHKATFWID